MAVNDLSLTSMTYSNSPIDTTSSEDELNVIILYFVSPIADLYATVIFFGRLPSVVTYQVSAFNASMFTVITGADGDANFFGSSKRRFRQLAVSQSHSRLERRYIPHKYRNWHLLLYSSHSKSSALASRNSFVASLSNTSAHRA